MIRRLFENRALTFAMARRELFAPHRNQFFGRFWVFWNPIFFALLISYVFNYVFGAKFGGSASLPRDYPTFVLSGILPWQAFVQVLARSPTEAASHVNLVKQVVFPVETLPAASVLICIFPALCGQTFLLLYMALYTRDLPVTALLLPVLLMVQAIWMAAIAYMFFVIGALFKDLKDVVYSLTTAGVYLLPIIYIPGAVPKPIRGIVKWNPFGLLLRCYQDALYFGHVRTFLPWVLSPVIGMSCLWVAWRVFRKLRGQIGAVL